jgi:hypothetical protein
VLRKWDDRVIENVVLFCSKRKFAAHMCVQLCVGRFSCSRRWSGEAQDRKKRKLAGKAFLSHEHVRPQQKGEAVGVGWGGVVVEN